MALPNGADYSSTQQLLDAEGHVWNHIFSFINSLSLKCAIELGIPDAIHKHGKPMTLSQLTDALAINKAKSRGLYRLMRILVHSKIFDKVKISEEEEEEEEEEEAYRLTRASCLLLREGATSMAPLALAVFNPVMMDPWKHVSDWFQNEDPTPFVTKHGRNAWEYSGIDHKWNQLYYEATESDARFVASILVKECKHMFEGLKTMVDVGGGTGVVAKAIVDAFPGLKCMVLELPHAVDGLEGSENLSFVSGDMFESIPHADAVFLKV